MEERTVFTIGPEQPWKSFLRFLKALKIEVLADVRADAATTGNPYYRVPVLQAALAGVGISYRRYTPQESVRWATEEARYSRIALLCSDSHQDPPCQFSRVGQLLSAGGLRVHHLHGEAVQVEVFTIGATRHSAPEFFGTLRKSGIKRLLDVRLNNWTQLAGFTKRDDLPFFLRELCDIDYMHELLLAPSRELLNAYKKDGGDWRQYERDFLALMAERRVEEQISVDLFDIPTVLLCYEAEADFCHRRLVLDYLQEKWGGLKITHL